MSSLFFATAFGALSPLELVALDNAALATHMRDCQSARGSWFATRSVLQKAGAFAAGRVVTLTAVLAALVLVVAAVV